MLFPERMKDLTILVHHDHIQEVIDSLHEKGVVEISSIDRDAEVMKVLEEERGGIPDIVGKCTDYDMKLTSVLDVFGRVEEEDEGIMEMLNPSEIKKIKRRKKTLPQVFDEIDEILEKNGEQIKGLDDELSRIEDELTDLRSLKRDLISIKDLDIDLSNLGESYFTVIRIGKTADPSELKKALSGIEESFCSITQAEEEYFAVTGAYIRKKDEFEAALRKADFHLLELGRLKGYPRKALKNISAKIENLEQRREDLMKELKDLKDEFEKDYLALREELDIYREKREVSQNFGDTDTCSVIKAWAPEDKVGEVERTVIQSSDSRAEVIAEDPEDPDEVPISLDNPDPIKPFELLTKMFSPPRYDEVDPTIILAPAFIFFFGLMLGDAVYGALIIITSIILIRGMGKIDEGARRFGGVLFACGVSTVIFGILQGGYLGPDRPTYPNLLGRLGISLPTLLQTLKGDGPLLLLIISLVIGLTYINVALILAMIQHIRRGKYRKIFKENLSWWTLQPGGFILLSGKLFGWYSFSNVVYIIAGVLSAVGLVSMVLRAKGLSFFELTGFIGDFLSFSRILALGLATSGIALTVNILADLIAAAEMSIILTVVLLAAGAAITVKGFLDDNNIFKIAGSVVLLMGGLGVLGYAGIITASAPFYILGLFIIIGGHLANAVLQALGSFVHSLRLQYVEFFGYFYEGGGSSFTPFKSEREHTKLEEDVIG